jgi:hypothetical protein
MNSCDVYILWPNADQLIQETPIGYVLDGELKHPFWAIQDDPLHVYKCQMALTKFLDGSPVAVRYYKHLFVEASMCPRCHRDLDFIHRVLGPDGLKMHERAHERQDMIERLKEIRDGSCDILTQEALDNFIKEIA